VVLCWSWQLGGLPIWFTEIVVRETIFHFGGRLRALDADLMDLNEKLAICFPPVDHLGAQLTCWVVSDVVVWLCAPRPS
jgi:hypothetical protein